MGVQEEGLGDGEARWVDDLQEVVVEVAAEQPGLMRGDLDPDPASVPGVHSLEDVRCAVHLDSDVSIIEDDDVGQIVVVAVDLDGDRVGLLLAWAVGTPVALREPGLGEHHFVAVVDPDADLAIGGKVIKCRYPLNVLKDTCDRSCY